MNKTALTLSAILTAFVLFLAGGVLYTVRSAKQIETAAQGEAPAAVETSPTTSDTPPATVDEQVQQAILEREATYQELINQANARLEQAQQENQTLQAQVNTLTGVTAPAAGTTVTSEQALQLALQFLGVGQDQIYVIQSISFEGVDAYQVAFKTGDVVVVGTDGTILAYFPPQAPPILSGNAGGGSLGAQNGDQQAALHRSGEHEGGDHASGDNGSDDHGDSGSGDD